jgi:hypothetical protein
VHRLSAITLEGITDPSILEILACREAQALPSDLGLTMLFVAPYCKGVVSDIQEGSLGKK